MGMDDTQTDQAVVRDPNYTYFDDVYKVFLGMVDSYEFSQLGDEILADVLYGYLDRGRAVFATYISRDFYDDDFENKRFNFKLTAYERTILAKAMNLEWIREHKNTEELMQKAIGDRDYSATQGYQYLDKLQSVEAKLAKEIKQDIIRIEYANVELYGGMK